MSSGHSTPVSAIRVLKIAEDIKESRMGMDWILLFREGWFYMASFGRMVKV